MNVLVFLIPIMLGAAAIINYKRYCRMMGTGRIAVILNSKFRSEMFAFLTFLSLIAIFLISELATPLV